MRRSCVTSHADSIAESQMQIVGRADRITHEIGVGVGSAGVVLGERAVEMAELIAAHPDLAVNGSTDYEAHV